MSFDLTVQPNSAFHVSRIVAVCPFLGSHVEPTSNCIGGLEGLKATMRVSEIISSFDFFYQQLSNMMFMSVESVSRISKTWDDVADVV